MRELKVTEFLTLDGIGQAPGGPDEDRDEGFDHGGWHMAYMDEIGGAWVDRGITTAGGFVLGRRTYEIFAAYWPNAGGEESEIARPLNELPKYVASTTLREPLEWQNSKLLGDDVVAAVRALKEEPGGDLVVIGSIELAHTLLASDVVDELQLMIDPVVVGGGKRLFRDDGVLRHFRLVDHEVTTTGVLLASYRRAEASGSR
jgi:dihydrofolate reductase